MRALDPPGKLKVLAPWDAGNVYWDADAGATCKELHKAIERIIDGDTVHTVGVMYVDEKGHLAPSVYETKTLDGCNGKPEDFLGVFGKLKAPFNISALTNSWILFLFRCFFHESFSHLLQTVLFYFELALWLKFNPLAAPLD